MGKKKRLGMVLTAWLATLMHAMATCMPRSLKVILFPDCWGNLLPHAVAACPAQNIWHSNIETLTGSMLLEDAGKVLWLDWTTFHVHAHNCTSSQQASLILLPQ